MDNTKPQENNPEAVPALAATAGYAFDRPWTWKDKLRVKLFPPQHCDVPEAPAHFEDALVCRVVAELSFVERLRVLASGRLQVETKTITEHTIGGHKTQSAFCTLPPKWWKRAEA
jgi:hypothetical protein